MDDSRENAIKENVDLFVNRYRPLANNFGFVKGFRMDRPKRRGNLRAILRRWPIIPCTILVAHLSGAQAQTPQAIDASKTEFFVQTTRGEPTFCGVEYWIVFRDGASRQGETVVGMVETPGGGDRVKSEDQPEAIAYAPQPTMRSPHPEREAVPVGSDAERPLSDARGKVPGCSEG